MARLSSRATAELSIRRHFDPSRSQSRSLAFAFEQALPLIRKSVNNPLKQQVIEYLDSHPNVRSAASGARS
jgi:hypothetical protein